MKSSMTRHKKPPTFSNYMLRKLRLERDEEYDEKQKAYDRRIAGLSEEIYNILKVKPLSLYGLRIAFTDKNLYWDYEKILYALEQMAFYKLILVTDRGAIVRVFSLNPDPPADAAKCLEEPEPLYAVNPCVVCGEKFTVTAGQARGKAAACGPPKDCRKRRKNQVNRELHQRRREAAV